MWCFCNTDTPGPTLSIHADGGSSRHIHIYWPHVLDGRNGSSILGGRRDDDGVWLEERCVCDSRSLFSLLSLLSMSPGRVDTSPREIARTPMLTDVVAKVSDVVFKSWVA